MKPRVLIVDDERSMCELIEVDLRIRDFAPVWFTAAEEAFERDLPGRIRRSADGSADARHGRDTVLLANRGQPAGCPRSGDDGLR